VMLTWDRDIVAGMDPSQTEESLSDEHWASEVDYHPFSKGSIGLE
jgi:hypothetical protein